MANKTLTGIKNIKHFTPCVTKQGRTVADGWAGAIMQKPFEIQQYLLPTYRPTWQGVESRVRD